MLNFDEKKMKKNGYTEVYVEIPVEGIDKGEKVFVSATEFGQLDDDALVSCIKSDNKTILIPKGNLRIKLDDK